MAKEIERKFLVTGDFKQEALRSFHIIQGYLSSVPERTVRVRIKDEKGVLTIKGKSGITGISRYEWEKEIPFKDAQEILLLCEPGRIDKTRYLVPFAGHVFEVDEFHGEQEGLVIAEIELLDENEAFQRPSWLGQEVTGDPSYYNASLSKNSSHKCGE